jgi:AGZA family xanthine/uracil permease-like MFS transporter
VREWIINAIPRSLKMSIAAGIGLFLGIIALKNAGIVVDHPVTLVTLGDMTEWPPLLAILGFLIIVALEFRRVPGAVIIGVLCISAISVALGLSEYKGIFDLPPDPTPTLLQLDIAGAFQIALIPVIFAFFFVDMFDTAGTLIGVSHRGNLLDAEGKLPGLRNALVADSGATIAGTLLGTSSTTSYIESAAGINAGGRTGLTAVTVAALFLLALFLAPLAGMVPAFATAPALLYVAALMAKGLAEIEWDDVTESAPAMVTAITMPLTFSIADGIGLGFITYGLIKILSGKVSEAKPAVLVIGVLFVLKLVYG